MPAINDYFGKSSSALNYAIATTVKTTRTSGVAVLEAFDLSRYAADTPVYFITYKKTTDPVTNIVSVTSLVSWKGLVNVGANTLTNLTLAPGYADTGNAVGDFIECIPTSYWENSLIDGIFVGHNPNGTFKKAALQSALGNDGNLVSSLDDITADFVVSGGIWALVSGLNGSMTLLTTYIDGYKNTVAAVATRAFTASKDTYVDVLRNTGTNVFTLVYTEVVNNAASPALAADSIRLAKVVTSGAAITSIVQTGDDAVGNIIYPIGASISSKNIQNPHKFSVYRNAAWNLPSAGGVYPVLFDTKEYDTGTNYNTATGLFTAPVAGFYKFDAYTNTTITTGDTLTASLFKNGVQYKYGIQAINNSGFNQFGSSIVSPPPILLAAGDTIGIQITHAASYVAGGSVGAANTYFGGSLVNRV